MSKQRLGRCHFDSNEEVVLAVCEWLRIQQSHFYEEGLINPLNAELNAICHLLALLGAHHIFHVSGLRVKLVP